MAPLSHTYEKSARLHCWELCIVKNGRNANDVMADSRFSGRCSWRFKHTPTFRRIAFIFTISSSWTKLFVWNCLSSKKRDSDPASIGNHSDDDTESHPTRQNREGTWCTNFRNSRRQMCGVKQFQYRGSIHIKRHRAVFSRHREMAPRICTSVLIAFFIWIRLLVQARLLVFP